MTEETDAELWRRVRAGDPESFGDLFARHGPTIHRYALRRTGDRHQADDVVATVFLEAWRSRGRTELHHPTALPWLYGIATNVLRNWRRSRRRHDAALDRLAALAPPSPELLDVQAELADDARRLLGALPRLPRRELDALSLALWEGLSTAEIAVALAIPPGTVKSRLSRARRRLRSELDPDAGAATDAGADARPGADHDLATDHHRHRPAPAPLALAPLTNAATRPAREDLS